MPSKEPKTADAIRGFEYDWLACDTEGHVGVFSTAGGGYPPPEFLRDTDAHDTAIDALLATAPTTTPRFAPVLAGEQRNFWKEMAEHGLFAFDSDPNGGPYRMVAAPAVPLMITSLPRPAADVAARLKLSLRFATSTVLGEEELGCSDAA